MGYGGGLGIGAGGVVWGGGVRGCRQRHRKSCFDRHLSLISVDQTVVQKMRADYKTISVTTFAKTIIPS